MQAFNFTGDTFEPVRKPEPKTSKGGFYAFGKNSKSAISALSKEDRESKNKKLAEYRKIIGLEEGRDAADLTMANERAVDVALKRANHQSKQLVEVTVDIRN